MIRDEEKVVSEKPKISNTTDLSMQSKDDPRTITISIDWREEE